jgi:transcriptional regulator with XRE-family HTH domain
MSINVMATQPHEILKPQQLAAATHLAAGMSGCKIAALVGVTPETISRWKRNSDFAAHLNSLKAEALETDRERLRNLRGKAVDALEELVSSSSDATRLQAAKFILDAMLLDPDTANKGIGPTDPLFVQLGTFNPMGGLS